MGNFMAPALMGLQTSRGSRVSLAQYSEMNSGGGSQGGGDQIHESGASMPEQGGGRQGWMGKALPWCRCPFLSEAFSDSTWKSVESQN